MASEKVCDICHLGEDLLNLGELKSCDDCNLHIFCGLFSYNLPQSGEDDEGIDGFLVGDILKIRELHKKMQCYYCKETSPTVKCSTKNCHRKFHVKCGMDNKCLFQFTDGQEHRAYCNRHVDIQEKSGIEIHMDWWKCQICKEEMGPYHPIMSISSCCNQGFIHRECARLHARSAGYLTKCPCCGNADDKDGNNYRNFLGLRGIFCPNKDADWELTNDAYKSLLIVYKQCDAINCLCPKGREHSSARGKWYLFKCRCCGNKGIHKGCRQPADTVEFVCEDCNLKATENSLITVFTEHSTNNAEVTNEVTMGDDDNDDDNHDAVNPSTSRTVSDKSNREQSYEPEPVATPKVLKSRKTDQLTFRENVLVLVDQTMDVDQSPNVDPLCNEERRNMRKSRLEMFFKNAEFDSKPPPPPWLV